MHFQSQCVLAINLIPSTLRRSFEERRRNPHEDVFFSFDREACEDNDTGEFPVKSFDEEGVDFVGFVVKVLLGKVILRTRNVSISLFSESWHTKKSSYQDHFIQFFLADFDGTLGGCEGCV